MFKLKLILLVSSLLVMSQTQQAFAVTCKDAKQTVNKFNSQIKALDKRYKVADNMVNKLMTGTLVTKERASKLSKDCLKHLKGYSEANSFCNYTKDIGTYTYVCQTSECEKYLELRFTIGTQMTTLRQDVSRVILNSKECFSAIEVLNAQKGY